MRSRRPATTLSAALLALALAGCAPPARRPAPTSPPAAAPDGEVTATLAEVLRAEDLRRADLLPATALEHSRPAVRASAVRALGRIGDPGAADTVRARLADPDPAVRAAAAIAIARLDPAGAAADVAPLADDASASVRASAASAAGLLLGGAAAGTIRALLDDPDPGVRAHAAAATATGAPDADTVGRLAPLASDAPPEVRIAAAAALAEIARPGSAAGRGTEGFLTRRAARDALRTLAADSYPQIRAQVARGFAVPTSTEDTATLGTLSGDRDPLVRAHALRSLAYPGSPLVALADARVSDDDPVVRAALYEALGAFDDEMAARALVPGVNKDREISWLVAAGLPSLFRSRPDAATASAFSLVDHPSAEVRAALCDALAGVSRFTAPAHHDLVRRMAVEDVPLVREAAVMALRAFGIAPPDFPAEVLGSEDPRVRTALARVTVSWLAASRTPRSEAAALRILERLAALAPDDPSVRAQLAWIDLAAALVRDDRARALLEARAANVPAPVRERALAALAEAGDDAVPVPASADPPAVERYAEIAAWAATPRAALVRVERPGFAPGRFTMRLDVASAPLAAWAFARAAEEGRLDGVPFGGLVPGFRIRAGDPSDPAFDRVDRLLRDEPFDGPLPAGSVVLDAAGPDLATGPFALAWSPLPSVPGGVTRLGEVVQNFDGVVRLLQPGDRIVGVSVYEGDGTEPLPPIE